MMMISCVSLRVQRGRAVLIEGQNTNRLVTMLGKWTHGDAALPVCGSERGPQPWRPPSMLDMLRASCPMHIVLCTERGPECSSHLRKTGNPEGSAVHPSHSGSPFIPAPHMHLLKVKHAEGWKADCNS